ncbi:MAG: Uma2 family endonuclease [Arenicella sp.]|jgi:Uma2 family endonuclease
MDSSAQADACAIAYFAKLTCLQLPNYKHMGVAEKIVHSVVDYLEFEDSSQEKHEYHDGYIVNISGGTLNHSRIGLNIGKSLDNALATGNCIPYNSELKVLAEKVNSYYYPDGLVICGEPEFDLNRKDIVKNPTLLVEVLSESTENRGSDAFDRGGKFWNYRTIPSFREYVLISQDKPLVESFYKNGSGIWQLAEAYGLESSIPLHSLGIELKLADIFSRVIFEEEK